MIYLVRHGEAAAKWGDAPDPGLSARGKVQAETVAGQLIELGATSAISSPMLRCRETAEPFERIAGLEARIEPRISEIETPPDAGTRTDWLQTLMHGTWDTSPHDFTAWRSGIVTAIRSLPARSAVFTHFIAINAIVGLIEARPEVVVFRPGNASVTVLEQTGEGLSVLRRGEEIETRIL